MKKTMKKLIALVLAVSICMGFTVTGFADLIDPIVPSPSIVAGSVLKAIKIIFENLCDNIASFFSAIGQRLSELFGGEPEQPEPVATV
ncbi:MAG: hypothetical protein IKS39_08400 [Clostridia bacterium]|nr:hypothetical protein [Clostridia bacterium]